MNTPRTDAECAHKNDAYEFVNPPEWEWVVTADFARQLERELIAMTALADRLAEALDDLATELRVTAKEALTAYETHKQKQHE